jgi:uncharacterized protein YndB with AHSA1/START domain
VRVPPNDIDATAPVLAHHEIDIDAPLALVWELHTGVGQWPTWQPEISTARLGARFAPGSSFDWTTYGMAITSTIYDVVDQERTLWGGGSDEGITGVHEWRFRETDDGVHVTTRESFAGPAVAADAVTFQGLLDGSLVAWLDHLKGAAEAGG